MSRFHMFAIPHLNSGKASQSSCFAWYTYGATIAQVHMSAIEIILAVRGGQFSALKQLCALGDPVIISICAIQQKSSHCDNTGIGDDARVCNAHARYCQIFP